MARVAKTKPPKKAPPKRSRAKKPAAGSVVETKKVKQRPPLTDKQKENLRKGRISSRKGIPNKMTVEVKEAMKQAFDKVGGVQYLVNLALDEPKVFATLLGKLIPQQVEVGLTIKTDDLIDTLQARRRLLAEQMGDILEQKVIAAE